MFEVYYFPTFEEETKFILSKYERSLVEKYIIKNLEPNGDKKGKPLSFDFFREFKIGGKRVYFLVYKDIAIILLVNASKNKKDQQKAIDKIKENLNLYREYAEKLYEIRKKS
jgi:mRNA-degrading endonuclease RelE of RelBE toxin-antitoxin system